MGVENEDSESLWKGPSSVKDPRARRRMSATAASLLDCNDEEDDEGLDEPELLSVSVEETSSDFSAKSQGKKNADGALENTKNGQVTPVSSMVRLTEGMTGMFCPSSLEGAETVVAVNMKAHHQRMNSETDNLQVKLSSGPCGTTGFCITPKEAPGVSKETAVNESLSMIELNDTMKSAEVALGESSSTLERTDTLKKTQLPRCTDFNLLSLQEVVATDILAILGSSTGVAADWFATLGSWLIPATRESHHGANRRVFRNRCGMRTAQAHRLRELWYKWHSDGSDDSGSKLGSFNAGSNPNMPPFRLWSLAVTKSLDDAEMVAALSTIPDVPGSRSFHQHDFAPMNEVQVFTSGTSRRSRADSPADLYYDSDPETFRVARHSPSASTINKDDYIKKKPLRWRRRITIDTTSSLGSKDVDCPLTPRGENGKGGHSFDVPSFDSDERFDLQDDGLVKDFIKELTTEKVNLIWHPSSKEPSSSHPPSPPSNSPVSVKGWFEMGSRLYNRVIQPKFMWRETYQPELLNRKRLGLSGKSPHSLDLLNIIRILKPATLDRSMYPFAKLDRTFTILSHTNELHVFEATSTEERDWLVHGLKLVVARLASMIIVGDDHMFVEFFSPWATSPVTSESSEDEEQGLDATATQPAGKPSLFVSTTNEDRENLWGAWK